MNMISQDVQEILAVDPTMQGNDETERIPRYGCPSLIHLIYLHYKKKAVRVISFPELPPHINSPCSWENKKIGFVGEYHLLPLVCRPAHVISSPLQPFLNVDSSKQKFPDGSSSIIYPVFWSHREQFWSKLDYADGDLTQQSLWR